MIIVIGVDVALESGVSRHSETQISQLWLRRLAPRGGGGQGSFLPTFGRLWMVDQATCPPALPSFRPTSEAQGLTRKGGDTACQASIVIIRSAIQWVAKMSTMLTLLGIVAQAHPGWHVPNKRDNNKRGRLKVDLILRQVAGRNHFRHSSIIARCVCS